MNTLAFETSSTRGEIAVLQKEQLLGRVALTPDQRPARWLVPIMMDLLKRLDLRLVQMDLVAVSQGPGSFTGLRIGLTTAKTLAYALKTEVVGVPTLNVIAYQARAAALDSNAELKGDPILWCVMDAQRRQLFATQVSMKTGNSIGESPAVQVIDKKSWIGQLRPGQYVSGPGLRRVTTPLPDGVIVTDSSHWDPRADSVGRIAWRDYQSGRRDDLWRLKPDYHRLSAAEEKRADGAQELKL